MFEVLPDPDKKTAHVPLPDGRSIPVRIVDNNRAWRHGIATGAALGAIAAMALIAAVERLHGCLFVS